MQDENTLPVKPLSASCGVVVVDGHDAKLYVRSGQLQVEDVRAGIRRRGTFPRAKAKLSRVIVVGSEGFVTLEAIRWLAGVGASFIHLGRDGRLFASSADYGLDDSRLRRAQVLAKQNGVGVRLAQAILAHKLCGQESTLSSLGATAARAKVAAELERLLAPQATFDSIRLAESKAAAAYWKAWEKVPVRFAKAEAGKVPEHWLSFGPRHSPLTASPRLAANPANAVLNYLYAIAEVECRIACFAVGLDPAVGIVHADQRARDSMALDLIEAIRPSVDAFALDLLRSRTFSRRDFFELPSGNVRVRVLLARALSGTCLTWRQHAAPVAEEAARILASGSATSVPTPLTQDNRSKGRKGIRKAERKVRVATSVLPRACVSCGVVFEERHDRAYCDDCLAEFRVEQVGSFSACGRSTLARMRAEGNDPAQTSEAKAKMGAKNADHGRAGRAWNHENARPDNAVFRREILPGLQGIPLQQLAEATGLSVQHCGLIRRGLRVPHSRHWQALQGLLAATRKP